MDEIVYSRLDRIGLLDEVRDRLDIPATALSGDQQQRLCIARATAVNRDVILLDEPCSSLDPIATARIEELMEELQEKCTIVSVCHNMEQTARASQRTALFHLGALVGWGDTERIFTSPTDERTQGCITDRYG